MFKSFKVKKWVNLEICVRFESYFNHFMTNYQLTGEFTCKLDAKGRLRLPSALLRQIGYNGVLEFVINRGFENHLMMYPKDVWGEKTKKINQLNIYNKRERQAMRYFYRGASMVAMDTSDRVLIPSGLVDYAGLEKEVVLFAYHEQIEIWSKSAYEAMLNEEPDSFDDIADKVFGGEDEDNQEITISI